MNKDAVWHCEYCDFANDGLKCTQCGASLAKDTFLPEDDGEITSPYYATREQMFGKYSGGGVKVRTSRQFNAAWSKD